MDTIETATANAGEEVVRAVGALSATVQDAAQAATETGLDHEEVQGWLTTIFKAVLAVFGK